MITNKTDAVRSLAYFTWIKQISTRNDVYIKICMIFFVKKMQFDAL